MSWNDDDRRRTEEANAVHEIAESLRSRPREWATLLPAARSLMASVDIRGSMAGTDTKEVKIRTIEVLQRLAFADVDDGGVVDISNWCLVQLMSLLQQYPGEAQILEDIGRNWLLRAQPFLSRIHVDSGSSSSGSQRPSQSTTDDQRPATSTFAHADDRLHTQDYLEARGILLPATEYFGRAVEAARASGTPSAGLFTEAAEAFMSLGNVSYSRTNERYFCQAIRYLREAASIPGYTLPTHLQQYLEDYGRFVESTSQS